VLTHSHVCEEYCSEYVRNIQLKMEYMAQCMRMCMCTCVYVYAWNIGLSL